jgi:hypothetical protein
LDTAILRGLIEKGVVCRFYEYRALLKDIQQSYNLAKLFYCQVPISRMMVLLETILFKGNLRCKHIQFNSIAIILKVYFFSVSVD